MKHLIICTEYPPVAIPAGGIGTYALHISRLLAESGETVHVISRFWKGAEKKIEEHCNGKLIIHRVPLETFLAPDSNSSIRALEIRGLMQSDFPPQCFSWQASLLAEKLVAEEGIDIIEAQEFHAPLYYFQLRRALGLGPERHPPCIVHLHTPTEFVARYNEEGMGHPYLLTAKRLEDYSIVAADALICPSRFLARQAEVHYGLPGGAIRVIPYPLGDNHVLTRDEGTWEHGTICYVGRLERRKGVIEWIDAAIAVAPEYPTANFEFVGTNQLGTRQMSGEEFISTRIPKNLKIRFHFAGEQERSSVRQFLADARMAVVPSRWENFPYACIEAMGSGLPVIASQEGGMVEMIMDGQTGWLTGKAGPEGLAEALRCALETPHPEVAEMGRKASADIRQICDNQKIVENHLNFRSQIFNQGSKCSGHLPANLSWPKKALSYESSQRPLPNRPQEGLAIVVICFNNGHLIDKCLQSLKRQERNPAAVVIIDAGSNKERRLRALDQARAKGWPVIANGNRGVVSTKNSVLEAVLTRSNPLGFAFLSAEDRLYPGFVGACESVLRHCPEVGVVSCWAHDSRAKNRTWVEPCPSFPYQWFSNGVPPFFVVRTDALMEAGEFHPVMEQGFEGWSLVNAVMAAGWVAVTIPEILIDHGFGKVFKQSLMNLPDSGGMGKEILKGFPDLISGDAQEIIFFCQSVLRFQALEMQQQFLGVRSLPRHLRAAAWQILRRVKKKIT